MVENGKSIYLEETGGRVLSTFNQAVRGSFLSLGKGFELEPSIVKKWKWDSTDNSYILMLDESAKFHDGTKPTIEDFEFSLLRGFFSSRRTFFNIYLGSILGVDKVKPGDKYKSGLVSGVKKIDAHTLRVSLSSPNPAFLYTLTRPFFSLSSQRFYKDDLMTWKKWPIGAGQFKVSAEDDNKVVLTRVSDIGSVSSIEMFKRHIEGADYDISLIQSRIRNESAFITERAGSILALFYSRGNELAADVNFRKSLYYGINRQEIGNLDPTYSVAFEFLPSMYWLKGTTIDPFNLKLAREFSKKVNQKAQKKKWKIPFLVSSNEFNDSNQKLVNVLERQFKKIGYDFSFYPSSEKFLSEETAQISPISLGGIICDNMDPMLMFGIFKSTSSFKFEAAQFDSYYDKLFEITNKEQDIEKRISNLRKLSNYTVENGFMVPLFENKNMYYFQPNTIKSLGAQPEPVTLDFSKIEFKKGDP